MDKETEAILQETAENMLSAVGDAEDAQMLVDRYLTADPAAALGVITEAGVRNLRRHVEENIPQEAWPEHFVDFGSADGTGVLAAARHWRGLRHYWGVELFSGRHRTAVASLDELWLEDPEAAGKCSFLNEDILSVLPLISIKAVYWTNNVAFPPELNDQLAAALDRYAPEGSLLFLTKPMTLARAEPFPGGEEVLCPQSWDSSRTAIALRLRGPPAAAAERQMDFPGALRASFKRFAAASRGVQLPATKAAAALSEALLSEFEEEEVTAALWNISGAGQRRPEAEAEAAVAAAEREELLAELQEEAEALGISVEALRTAYGELERLDEEEDEEEQGIVEVASPWKSDWHQGVLDGVAPWETIAEGEERLYLSWGTFEDPI